jgi:hypothetical protein
MSLPNGFSSSGLIDFWRESTEAALDLSKNLTSAQSPGEFFAVLTKFAEGQYSAAEKYAYQVTGQTLPGIGKRQLEAPAPRTAESAAATPESDNAALIAELQEQVDALSTQLTAVTEQLAALEGREPLKVKFAFGEPPHTGWTPTKVVVLGNDSNGNLVELPSSIEEGGFSYIGAPSFWIAIG